MKEALSGVDRVLTAVLAPWREPRMVLDPGKVLLDVALAVALGGDCLTGAGLLYFESALQ
nr:hypothetical protein [Streptomyces alboflavus]